MTLAALDAEKLQKPKWPKYCETPCIYPFGLFCHTTERQYHHKHSTNTAQEQCIKSHVKTFITKWNNVWHMLINYL